MVDARQPIRFRLARSRHWWLALLRSPVAPYLLLGVLLRLCVMPFTLYTDMGLMFWQATETVAAGHADIYDYAYRTHGQEVFSPLIWSPYGPAFYFVAGGWISLLRWLGLHPFAPWTAWDAIALLPRAAFLVKLLYLLVEAGLVWLLCRINGDERPDARVVALWMLNPNVLYTSYMMGQNDILPLACVVTSLWAGSRALRGGLSAARWADLAAAMLGLGGAFKLFPLACLPIAVLLLGQTIWARARLLILGVLPFAACIAPYLSSRAFQYSSLFNHEATGVLGLVVPWPNGLPVSVPVVVYVALLLGLWLFVTTPRREWLLVGYGVALATLFVFGPPLPQWHVWIVPFLVLFAVELPRIWALVALQMVFFSLWITSAWNFNGLGVGLFSLPVSYWFSQVPPLKLIIDRVYSFDDLLAGAYALYLCAFAFIIIVIWRGWQAVTHHQHGRWPRLGVAVLPVCMLIGVLCANLLVGQRFVLGAEQTTSGATVPLAAGVVGQRFVAPPVTASPVLRCIDLSLRKVGQYTMTPLRLQVFADGNATAIATTEATPSGDDAQWKQFCFQPIVVAPGHSYHFDVTATDPNSPILVVSSKKDSAAYPDGALMLNGQPDPDGADLNFRLLITLPWNDVGRDIARRVGEDPVFFGIYGLVFLGCVGSLCVVAAQRWRAVRAPTPVLVG